MIPSRAVDAWREFAPWIDSAQVEQDLIISRALVEIYSDAHLREAFAFRGGTALQKLFFSEPTRYSEDIDLVQVRKEKIGKSVNALRGVLDSWLGKPSFDSKRDRFTLYYKFQTEIKPIRTMKLKVEINNAEQFSVFPLQRKTIKVENIWFTGSADILTYQIEELLGTKMRALYQRKKGRDLYDLAIVTRKNRINAEQVVQCFRRYLREQKKKVSRAEFEKNLSLKIKAKGFNQDIQPLLVPGSAAFDVAKEGDFVSKTYLSLLPGKSWKGIKPKQ